VWSLLQLLCVASWCNWSLITDRGNCLDSVLSPSAASILFLSGCVWILSVPALLLTYRILHAGDSVWKFRRESVRWCEAAKSSCVLPLAKSVATSNGESNRIYCSLLHQAIGSFPLTRAARTGSREWRKLCRQYTARRKRRRRKSNHLAKLVKSALISTHTHAMIKPVHKNHRFDMFSLIKISPAP